MDSNNEKGAATAEFMLLLPTFVIGLAAFLALTNWQVERLELSTLAFSAVRAQTVGAEWSAPKGVSANAFQDGRYSCVELSKAALLPMRVRACALQFGS